MDTDFNVIMKAFDSIGIPYERAEWIAGKAVTLKSVEGDGELDIYFFHNGRFNEVGEKDKTDWR